MIEKQRKSEVLTCNNCGATLPAHAKFCLECGSKVARRCSSCGVMLPENAKFCLECGTRVAGIENTPVQSKIKETPVRTQAEPVIQREEAPIRRREKAPVRTQQESMVNDVEALFGNHNEYYVNPQWQNRQKDKPYMCAKGYMEYSKYGKDIYFVSKRVGECNINGGYIIKCDPVEKIESSIKVNRKEDYKYIAVNRRGIFLYNEILVTLFDFDGKEIYSHKFGQKKIIECITIFDDTIFYSETKTTGIVSKIYSVNMLSQEFQTIWECEKGDTEFEHKIVEFYEEKWKEKIPYFKNPSHIGSCSCEFLFANANRVIAGYVREKGDRSISYIISVDINSGNWDVLDCILSDCGEGIPRKKSQKCIFSFNMSDDTMWVRNEEKTKLLHVDINKVIQVSSVNEVWVHKEEKYSYPRLYFDGKNMFHKDWMSLDKIECDGTREEIMCDNYAGMLPFCVMDDIYLLSRFDGNHPFYDIYAKYEILYNIPYDRMEELTSGN